MHFEMSSAICFNSDWSKNLLSGNELKTFFMKQLTESCILWHAENLRIAKSFFPCQPVGTVQTDTGLYF